MLNWNEFTAVVQANYEKRQITISANDQFLTQKIKEELASISNEGNVKAQIPQNEDDIVLKGERFLKRGLPALRENKRKVSALRVDEIRELISKAKLEEALEAALGLVERKENHEAVRNIRLLLSQFRKNEKEENLGLVNHEDYLVRINNMTKALEEELDGLAWQ